MQENKETVSKQGLFSQLQGFNKSSLKKTETTITTEDGKKLRETHDSSGNFKATVTNKESYGFVPDLVLDLQVGEVLPGLIVASQDVAAEWDILEKYAVTHILNVASYVNNYFPDRIKYKNLKINDTPDCLILNSFPVSFEFIDEARKTGCVLVHCNAGRSRAASICIGYLMKTEGMSFQEAYEHVKNKRPGICPNPGFVFQLKETYAETLKQERNKDK